MIKTEETLVFTEVIPAKVQMKASVNTKEKGFQSSAVLQCQQRWGGRGSDHLRSPQLILPTLLSWLPAEPTHTAPDAALHGPCLLKSILCISPMAGTQCELAQETDKKGLLLWPASCSGLVSYHRNTKIHIADAPRTGEV